MSLIILLAAGAAAAQTGSLPGDASESRTAVRSEAGMTPIIPSMFEPIMTGGLLDDTLVRNKPLAAVFESKTAQLQANGTSLVRRITTKVYRDSDGRVRREQIFHASDAASMPGEVAQTISIYDPVARYGYSINGTTRTALRYKLPQVPAVGAPLGAPLPLGVEILRNDNAQTGAVRRYRLEPARIEPLGRQQIAGVEAEGVRVTIKVPAGAVGNANPVETVYETWIVRDLQMLVKSVASNPLRGEHTFRLITINRAEQPRSLFEVPAGYPISNMGVPRTDVPPPLR